jgi:serine protease inhibitor
MDRTAVAAANQLTAAWARTCGAGSTVLSGAGVLPLLAVLCAAASGPARTELSAAVGLPAEDAVRHATDLLAELAAAPAVRSALGVWSRADLPLTDWWSRSVPADVRGVLRDDPAASQASIDEWVERSTGGLLTRLPIKIKASMQLILASALSVRTRWVAPFGDTRFRIAEGPWAGRRDTAMLSRTINDLDLVAVVDTPVGPLTRLRVVGTDDVDVHLVLGEPRRRAHEVLPAAIESLTGRWPVLTGSHLLPGKPAPGVVVCDEPSRTPQPILRTLTPRFTVTGGHDLLARPTLFGLSAASNTSKGHFPGISPAPLAISSAAQDAVARFSAVGFEAAAVTAFGMMLGAALPAGTARVVSLRMDRPLGFVAVHRPTQLVLVAGWVAEPEEHPEEDY